MSTATATAAYAQQLQGALAGRGLSIRKVAVLTNTPRATLQRQFRSGAFRPETEAALLQLVDDPAAWWKRCVSCPAGAGWPPYPAADPHPAACALDAERAARDFLEALDGQAAPANWTDEQKGEIVDRALRLIQQARRLVDALRPKH